MSTLSDHWRLVESVRERCYDVFTFEEKKRASTIS
jgi:hypothetical protein